MRVADLQLMFDSHFSAFEKIYDATAELGDEIFVAPPAIGDRALRSLLVHTMNTERGWRRGILESVRIPGPPEEDFPSVAALRAAWDGEERDMRAYLAALKDEDLEANFAFVPVWVVLTHLYSHG